ncbi:MAG: hypothetical protein M0Q44_16815 [Methylobacter sp.]|jgi:hypothetical protein|nr:hypothetical protein [Methylobacter sp.]
MPGKDDIENIFDNTYGIEIEFGTHNCEMLSFTHIEVWNLYPDPEKYQSDEEKCKKNGWKIETDADYTLELVSPILQFYDQANARKYKTLLMRFLQQELKNGILITELTKKIKTFVETDFTYDPASGFWTFALNSPAVGLIPDFINKVDLIHDLAWFNWDEDSDLEKVLASKKILGSESGTDYRDNTLNSIVLTPSRKHGGLPSSQMNIPLSLDSYVKYDLKYKLSKAWDRLLEVNLSEEKGPVYRKKMKDKLVAAYPGLAGDPVWKAKYLNDDYLDAQVDSKTPIWHRYWLWLDTFTRCADLLSDEKLDSKRIANKYKQDIDKLIKNSEFLSLEQAKTEIQRFKLNFLEFPTAYYPLTYLSVQKLVSGALSEMSEEQQGIAQQKVMALNGDMDMEDILDAFPGKAFFQFHYALKDLTSLWFKSPLVEVIQTEKAGTEFCAAFKKFDPAVVADVITTVLEANLSLLGWYYGVAQANNQEFDYEWDDFLSYNMPSVTAFGAELLETCVQFHAYLNSNLIEPPYVLCTVAQLPPDEATFLQRIYPEKKGAIARWEGRWDTMKKPITQTNPPRYLIEHRNN